MHHGYMHCGFRLGGYMHHGHIIMDIRHMHMDTCIGDMCIMETCIGDRCFIDTCIVDTCIMIPVS